MSENWLSCKGCVGSDPTRDTVKINASELSNKENVAPLGASSKNRLSPHEQESGKAPEQGAQRWVELQEEAAKVKQRQQEAREAAEAAEKARAAKEEERRRKLEEEARHQKLKEEETARKFAEELRLREEAQQAAEEAERLRREAEAAEAAQKAAEEEQMRRAEQQVHEWCQAHGFQDVNVERKTFKGRKYPLHTAVKHQEPEMVRLLVKCGARKDLKDSRGQTPVQLAQKISKSGGKAQVSQAILDALQ
mmetsp:Transcript_68909/g.109331  ORF Transcript_68909/g.109331 Transcript_68909/m.109331 type:complete len:250 (-) Transcript_68909:135-884(-)|eukprot:CAMPEP_0169123952 /NCGR_PEP_ID=MMETSP1015-20121227/34060_1 /TAXON_ID=342587 /ORGANISM="Karlodinium micrum, Strain CCMP2283" /LENGTH=249 /DNA_ID=CAMNT_0009187325 /DNA_START=60 /DNA_END=809 /DNA_ORIENTATION=-